MRKIMVIMAMALVLCGAFAMSAQATYTIDFEIAPIQTGNIPGEDAVVSFGGNNLFGSFIKIDKITGIGTPANSGASGALTNTTNDAFWNFTAPKLTSTDTDHYIFTGEVGTTSLNISGTFTNGANSVTDPVPLNLGTFTNAELHRIGTTNNWAVTGVFTDFKSDALMNYFGISGQFPWEATFTFGVTLPAGTVPPDTFTSTAVQSGDITQVPVPPSVLLLGSGLLGLVGLRFRKNRA